MPLQHSGGLPVGYIEERIHSYVIKFRFYTQRGIFVVGFLFYLSLLNGGKIGLSELSSFFLWGWGFWGRKFILEYL